MNQIFSQESILYRIFSTFANWIVLNLCFLVASLPVVTIGASFSAMYTVVFAWQHNQHERIIQTFCNAYVRNFKQATMYWLSILMIWIFSLLAFGYLPLLHPLFELVGLIVGVTLFAQGAIMFIYGFALIARFELSFLQILQLTAKLIVEHKLIFIQLLAIHALLWILPFTSPFMLGWVIGIDILFGFAMVSHLNSYYLVKMTEEYIKGK